MTTFENSIIKIDKRLYKRFPNLRVACPTYIHKDEDTYILLISPDSGEFRLADVKNNLEVGTVSGNVEKLLEFANEGATLIYKRKRANVRPSQLATMFGVTRQKISGLEQGTYNHSIYFDDYVSYLDSVWEEQHARDIEIV